MEYIERLLRIKVRYRPWQYKGELPYYLLERYEFRKVLLDRMAAVFLYPKGELDQMASVRKQIARIQKAENLPVVIVMDKMSRNQREYLIASGIPFVVPDKQLYLPFMGIVLQEKFDAAPLPIEKLQPSAQVLFFYYLYQNTERIYANAFTKTAECSGMTLTRAVRQLEQTGLFDTEKDGTRIVLRGKFTGRILFEKMRPYLISPVRKVVYVHRGEACLRNASVAGLSALSEKSMISPPDVESYAVYGRGARLKGTERLMDASVQAEVELWKYDPQILGNNGTVDTLSLAMSLVGRTDERVEEALEDMMEEMWGEQDG